MAIYKEILETHEAARSYVAQAHYRLAMCYVKKGDGAQAIKLLDTILREFPDEKEVVVKAKTELARLTASLDASAVSAIVESAVGVISMCAEGDQRIDAQLAAVRGLDQEKALTALVPHLESDTANIRRAAIFIVYKVDFKDVEPVTPKLLSLTSHTEDFTRGMAALALGARKVAASYDRLAEMTLEDSSGFARRCGAIALGWLGDERAKPVLEAATKDSDTLVQGNARAALAMLAKPSAASVPVSGVAPRLLETKPVAFANDVEMTVTFDRKMQDGSWSWTGGGDTSPETTGPIHYDETRTTCTRPVRLKPAHVYWVGVNSKSYRNFRSAEGLSAHWYVILFATAGEDGSPTPIPDEHARRARVLNTRARALDAGAQSAIEWLALIDTGSYAESWETAAEMLRDAVDKQTWVARAAGVRSPLGAAKERQLSSIEYKTSLPGVPTGEYVVMTFETGFETLRKVVESVTVAKEGDDTWRILSYFIK
jgi:hypothetical protein